MSIANLADLVNHASANGYAVATVPVTCLQVLRASIEAAEESRAPLALALNAATTPNELAAAAAHAAAEARVPVSLLCTDIKDVDAALNAVRMGCNALSLHGNPQDFSGNVRRAREVRELLGNTGLTLEATLGSEEPETGTEWITQPSEVNEYSKRTSVDALHVGVGKNGKSGHPNLGRLSRLRRATPLPLSAAVRPSVVADDFHRLIARGVSRLDCAAPLIDAINDAISEETPLPGADSLDKLIAETAKSETLALFKLTHSAGRSAEVSLHCRRELSAFNVFRFEVVSELEEEAITALAEHRKYLYEIPGVQQVDVGYDYREDCTIGLTAVLRYASTEAMESALDHSAYERLTQAMQPFAIRRPSRGLATAGSVLPNRPAIKRSI